jgi:hypothetical protein
VLCGDGDDKDEAVGEATVKFEDRGGQERSFSFDDWHPTTEGGKGEISRNELGDQTLNIVSQLRVSAY